MKVNVKSRKLVKPFKPTPPRLDTDKISIFPGAAAAEAAALAAEHNFHGLAAKIRQITEQGVRECERVLSDEEFGRKILVDRFFEAMEKGESSDWKVTWVMDISKFGEYDADFGFGKPVWMSVAAALPLQDHIMLFNNRNNDGIEAWVFLQESDMQLFRQDKEIRCFASNCPLIDFS